LLSTKALYATTLMAASLAGFSTGWAVRPGEKIVLTERDRYLHEWTEHYQLDGGDRERLEAILDRYFADLAALRAEFDSKFGDRIGDLKDRYDGEILRVLTVEKRR
jgi:hypothetical protein